MRNECSPTEFLKIASHTAEHFGFKTVDTIRKEPACKNCSVALPHSISKDDLSIDSAGGLLTRGVELFYNEKLHAIEGPVLLYSIDKTDADEVAVAFHIFNVEKSIAEAILIQANRALANELGHTDNMVRINSLGDSDSMSRYSRELANFLRKRIDLLPADARELMKQHAFYALRHLVDSGHELAFKTPNPLEYLSDQSRKHFRDIIEYLDMSETPYEIDPKMLGHHEYFSDALFSIQVPEDNELPSITLRGGRFNEFLFRKTKLRTPAVGGVAILHAKTAPTRFPRFKLTPPAVYVIQLGFGPKIRSLILIDELRKAGIATFQDLANDSLSAQLRDAEVRGVRYVAIIGQKEFVDKTVILRDMRARKQEPITYDLLIKKLKRGSAVTA